MDLYSNFTYFLDDPVNGDEFQQIDDRTIYGGQAVYNFDTGSHQSHIHHNMGVQVRYDDIDQVGLYKTANRQRLSTVREDSVEEYSIGLFWDGEMHINDNLTANIGLRYDYLNVDVDSIVAANSGSESDSLDNNGGLQYQLEDNWTMFLNVGQSFHSMMSEARPLLLTQRQVKRKNLLIIGKSDGAEIGMRYFDQGHLNVSFGIWVLELDSELLFVGDAGNTEAGAAFAAPALSRAYYWATITSAPI